MKGLVIKSKGEVTNPNLPVFGEVTLYQGEQFGSGHIIYGTSGLEFETNMTCYSDSAMTTEVTPTRNTRFYTNPNDVDGKYFKIKNVENLNDIEMGNFYINDVDLPLLPATISMSNIQIKITNDFSLKYFDLFSGTFNGNLSFIGIANNIDFPQVEKVLSSSKLKFISCNTDLNFFENSEATEINITESSIITSVEKISELENLKVLYCGGGGGRYTVITWPSPTLRNSAYPFIAMPYGTYFVTSDDIDNYLINMANCVLPASSVSQTLRTILISGSAGRTSASDAAVATLKAASISITINNTPQ